MASGQRTVDYILEQIAGAGTVSAKKMFGEYGIYCDAKMVAVVCDDQLFVKITAAGKTLVGDCPEKPPFPGAKPWFLISGDKWDEDEWLTRLIRASTKQLPGPPKPPPRKSR